MNSLIADSGSTKTDWALLADGPAMRFRTQGINPYILTDEAIATLLREEVLPQLAGRPVAVCHFYGAGCRGERAEALGALLQSVLPAPEAHVHTDLFGAARALLGDAPGIAAILGTGANSGHYDGQELVENIPSLGYILGDEGSGAALGKRLLGGLFKKQLPDELAQAFQSDFSLAVNDVLQSVYRNPFPNRFLASFAPFLHEHRAHPAVHTLLTDEFSLFFERNILPYERRDLSVHFVGSIARVFEAEIKEAAQGFDLSVGRIIGAPMDGLITYHADCPEYCRENENGI